MYELKVKTRFAAAHQLRMVGKKCENLHGHNWKIEVILSGKELDNGGVLMDFGIIKKHLKKVIEELDHKFLNELESFSVSPPSSENIAKFIAINMQESVRNEKVRISRVTAWESDDSSATYIMHDPLF